MGKVTLRKWDVVEHLKNEEAEHEEERELFGSTAAKNYLDIVHRNEKITRGEVV